MAKTLARGTKLYVEDPALAGTYIAVGNLTNIGVPSPEKPEVDVTDMDSTAAEFLAGLPDNGELTFSGFYNATDAGQEIVMDDAHDPEAPTRTWRVDFVNQDERFEFDAFVKRFTPSAPGPNEAYTFEGTLRITGAVTISAIP